MLQLQHYLGITGLPWGAFAALVMGGPGGVKMVSIEVQRDDDMIETMREAPGVGLVERPVSCKPVPVRQDEHAVGDGDVR
jgi:predicted phage-related endonuclease